MNNKGFTLIELLFTISVISIFTIVFTISINNTFGLSTEKEYEIIKKSIINQAKEYIYECDNNLINCHNDYHWEISDEKTKKISINLNILKKYNYLKKEEYINPKTGEDISKCLIINAEKKEIGLININLDDSKCKK